MGPARREAAGDRGPGPGPRRGQGQGLGRGRRGAATLFVLAAGALAANPASALPGDIEAVTLAGDLHREPGDVQAVVVVCGRCHVSSVYLTSPRSYGRWEQVFAKMSRYGAIGSDEQLYGVIRYFDRNLTIVNLNTSPVEELGPVLQVSDDAADEIAALRTRQPIRSIADLKSITGIDMKKLELLDSKGRLQF